MNFKTIILSLFLLVLFLPCKSQNYQFSQFYSTPTYLNPAFTGADACSRAILVYRDQWPNIPGSFISYMASYDHYLNSLNSGVGILFFSDVSGYGGLTTNQFNLLYAYELRLTRKYALRFGLEPGLVNRNINYSNLLFGDQIARGNAPTSLEQPMFSTSYFDCSTGALLYSSRCWFGVSFIHITQPNQSLLYNGASDLPMEFRLHGGVKLYLNADYEKNDKQYLNFAFNYRSQSTFDQLDIGTYYAYEPLVFGFWYRGIPVIKTYNPAYANQDALCFLLGIHYLRFNFGYSYDLTISKLGYESGGAHEVTVRYNFCQPQRNKSKIKKRILMPCPKF
jgi:type IX secretion system PorP/SprF family membrane protein